MGFNIIIENIFFAVYNTGEQPTATNFLAIEKK